MRNKTPIIYEVDDLLYDIEDWNFANDWYKDKKHFIVESMKNCDGIITSTHTLKSEYSKYNNKIAVIENHLPKFLWGTPEFNGIENKKPKIIYAGSMNHFSTKENIKGGDFSETLLNFIRETVDKYSWIFIGGYPLELNDLKNNKIQYLPWQLIWNLPNVLKSIHANVAIAPLFKNHFNECKSNIKLLEYTAAGIPTICTNIDPYKNAVVKCETDEFMISKIEELAWNMDLQERTWEKQMSLLRSQMFWEDNDNILNYINTYLRMFGLEI